MEAKRAYINAMLDMYVADLKKSGRPRRGLSEKEERATARLIKAGDTEARNKLVMANLGPVLSQAERYISHSGPSVDIMDLVQEGNIGVIIAAGRHKPRKGRFYAYLGNWIHQRLFLFFRLKRTRPFAFAQLGEDIADRKPPRLMERVLDIEDSRRKVQRLFKRMRPLEREMIKMRFGFLDGEMHSFEEVGKRFGKTESQCKGMIFGCFHRLESLRPLLFS